MPYNKEAAEQFKKKYNLTIGAARNRLIRSIIFNLLKESDHHYCYRCGEEMTLDDFTIEHINPWAYKEDAWELFFDLANIAFSHSKCNSAHVRRDTKHVKKHMETHFKRTNTCLVTKTRKCYHCKKKKPLEEFVKNKAKSQGRGYICYECRPGRRKEEKRAKLDTDKE